MNIEVVGILLIGIMLITALLYIMTLTTQIHYLKKEVEKQIDKAEFYRKLSERMNNERLKDRKLIRPPEPPPAPPGRGLGKPIKANHSIKKD